MTNRSVMGQMLERLEALAQQQAPSPATSAAPSQAQYSAAGPRVVGAQQVAEAVVQQQAYTTASSDGHGRAQPRDMPNRVAVALQGPDDGDASFTRYLHETFRNRPSLGQTATTPARPVRISTSEERMRGAPYYVHETNDYSQVYDSSHGGSGGQQLPKAPLPKLDDERGDIDNWLAKVDAHFSLYSMTDDGKKILMLGNQLRDHAGVWWANKLRADPERSGDIFKDWPLFTKLLREQFGQSNPRADAYARLDRLRMANGTAGYAAGAALEYVERFRDLIAVARIDDEHALVLFQKGLTDDIARHFERQQPSTLTGWYNDVIQIGRNREALAVTRGIIRTRANPASTLSDARNNLLRPLTTANSATRRTPLPYHNARTAAPQSNPPKQPAQPVQTPTAMPGPRICYNCRQPGHQFKDCTEPQRVYTSQETYEMVDDNRHDAYMDAELTDAPIVEVDEEDLGSGNVDGTQQ